MQQLVIQLAEVKRLPFESRHRWALRCSEQRNGQIQNHLFVRGNRRRAPRPVGQERIRRDGYAVSVGEREDGAYSVVAPVMGGKGEIVASLSISGPIFRLSEEQKAANIQAVLKASREISALLGSADSQERITK